MTDSKKQQRHCPMALRLALSGVLIAHGFAAAGQTVGEPTDRLVLRQLAPSSLSVDGDRGPVHRAQFLPGLPQFPPLLEPRTGGTQGSMGAGVTMILTGDTMLEMMAGACTAGLFIGGISAMMVTAPAAPVSAAVIAGSAGIGCGFAVATTAAGLAGMLGWRAVYDRFK